MSMGLEQLCGRYVGDVLEVDERLGDRTRRKRHLTGGQGDTEGVHVKASSAERMSSPNTESPQSPAP
ncbi:hypothetical protein ACF1FE_27855 [Streptomyces griseofuscus]|uniref:hypothetical protein n=1 Tax=Streptomyces griseofuscus TaxID=146922 RepID=UPI0036FC4D7A